MNKKEPHPPEVTIVNQSEVIDEFLRAVGLDPSQCGDFEIHIKAPVQALVSGTFHIWISEENFAILAKLAPSLRRNAVFKAGTSSGKELEIR